MSTTQTNEQLAVLAQKGDIEATHQLWEKVKWLVYMLVGQHGGRCKVYRVEFDDILQSGYIAFTRAVKAYDVDKGFKFNSYLRLNIQNTVNETFGVRGKANYQFVDSLDEPIFSESDDVTLLDSLECDKAVEAMEKVEDNCSNERLRKQLFEIMDVLDDRQVKIIKDYYFNDKTFKDIADELEISQQRVSALHQIALNKLRTPFRMYKLAPFLYYNDCSGYGLNAYKKRGFVSRVEQLAGAY